MANKEEEVLTGDDKGALSDEALLAADPKIVASIPWAALQYLEKEQECTQQRCQLCGADFWVAWNSVTNEITQDGRVKLEKHLQKCRKKADRKAAKKAAKKA